MDEVTMVWLSRASAVMTRRVTVRNLLTTVPDLVMALFSMGVMGILHHLVVMTVSKVELVLLIRRRRIKRVHRIAVWHMLGVHLLWSQV